MKQRLFLFASGFCCATALAQVPAQPGTIEFRQTGPVSHACGGVGEGEQQLMKIEAQRHSLMLTFAVTDGAYLSDVDVEIRDARGVTVLTTRCEGPIMLVDLPAGGPWRVTATFKGLTRETTVDTRAARPAQATLLWPVGTSRGGGTAPHHFGAMRSPGSTS